MKGNWWRNAAQHALSDLHALCSVRARADGLLPRLLGPRLLGLRRQLSGSTGWSRRNLRSAGKGRHPWWDATTDEARFWEEDEHVKHRQRMDGLHRSLDTLRGDRSNRHSRG